VYELDFIDRLQQYLLLYENVVFDKEVDNLLNMAKADVMISNDSLVS
jgi:hypothetical protein